MTTLEFILSALLIAVIIFSIKWFKMLRTECNVYFSINQKLIKENDCLYEDVKEKEVKIKNLLDENFTVKEQLEGVELAYKKLLDKQPKRDTKTGRFVHKFKVGMFAEIIKNSSSRNKIGDVGIITCVGKCSFRAKTINTKNNIMNWESLKTAKIISKKEYNQKLKQQCKKDNESK